MKILHLDTGTGWRGGQQQVLWLMEGLRQFGQEQLLVAPSGSTLAEAMHKEGFKVGALGSAAVSLASVRALRRMAGGFDILHAHDAHGHSLAWLAGIARGHRSWPFLVVSRRVAFPIGMFGGLKYAAADAYIAVSDYGRQQLLKARVPDGKIHVVYDGVKPPPPPTPGARLEFRSRYGLNDRTPIVGTFTSLSPEKLLKEELDLVEDLPPSVHLWIGRPALEAGQRAAEAALLRYAKERGLEQRFRVIPLAGDLGRFLSSLDVFLYLSKSEGLGSAILLAMAHGLPVVASRVGGIPEIVRHQETGLLVGKNLKEELPAAVRLLLDSEPLRLQLASAAQKFVLANATVDMMVAKTFAVYEKLLQESTERGHPEDSHGSHSPASHPAGELGGRS